MSDLQGHSIYIATRRARLEAREAGFLVLQNHIIAALQSELNFLKQSHKHYLITYHENENMYHFQFHYYILGYS